MTSIKIMTVNCQGLGDAHKRTDLFSYLKSKCYNIYCLQDTHFTEKMEPYIQAQWGYKCIFNSYRGNARGVAIMINNNFECEIHKYKCDNNGNLILADMTIEGEKITIVNIYGPNEDNAEFYLDVFKQLEEFQNEKYLICGDFNLVLNQNLDTNYYLHVNNPKSQSCILDNLETYDLVDPFRELYPKLKRYTWRKKNPIKQARLDFHLISKNLMQFVEKVTVENSYRSDHSGVVLNLKFKNIEKGPGLWKFNNSLLKDSKYIDCIKEVIKNTKLQYAVPIYNINQINIIDPENLQLTVNDQLFLETLLMEIRGKTISYSSFKKKEQNKLEQCLNEDIKTLEENEDKNNIDILEDKKNELLNLRKEKLKGHFIRAKAKWIEEGEKPTNYFCNMESRNYYSKLIAKIEKENGENITDQKEILRETKNFYQTLYSKPRKINEDCIIEKLKYLNFNILSDDEAKLIEGEITYSEAKYFLKNMKNDKSPGSDGFTTEFFKFFWIDIGYFIVRSINYSYNIKEMSNTQKLGIITCIPKPDKQKEYLKNWRPISLLNCVYKIASGCIANRIKKTLDTLISKDQTGFIKGRFIGENIRLIYDIMQYTDINNMPGLLLLVDFEKAFDSVSWEFIQKVLSIFNFKDSIKCWIQTLYNNAESAVTQNGFISERFKLERGCRQGDPLSPYIFILCAEILAILIKSNPEIKGIEIEGEEYLISQYADDTSFMLDGSPSSLDNTLRVLDYYAGVSGLKINYTKTKVIWIGSKKFSSEVFHRDKWKLEWGVTNFKLLGINFSVNLDQITDQNYDLKIREIKSTIKNWSHRKLTMLGRNTVLKTLIIPKITHLIISLPNPNEKLVKDLEKLFFNFIWENKPEKIKRDILIQDYGYGGIKMISLPKFFTALKCTWIRRIIKNSESKWAKLSKVITNINLDEIYNCGDYFIDIKQRKIINNFWNDVLQSWKILQKKEIPKNFEDMASVNIFYNSNIRKDFKPIIYTKYIEKNITMIHDLMDVHGNLLKYENFIARYDVDSNFLEYNSLISSVKSYQKKVLGLDVCPFQNLNRPKMSYNLKSILKDEKGCKEIYGVLKRTDIHPKAQTKYANLNYNISELEWRNYYILPFKITKNTTSQWFQYRILHRILATNSFLYKINYVDSDKCTFCNNEVETLEHLFYDCYKVYELWESIQRWIFNTKNEQIELSKKVILLGYTDKQNKVLNWLILNIKQYIYRTKIQKHQLNIFALQNIIKKNLEIERYILFKNCRYDEFYTLWFPWFKLC